MLKNQFSSLLLYWHKNQNNREMPWKGEKDPYKIWISEIILQQTRVDQGLDYYMRFIAKYPSVADLAKAPEEEIFKLWEGLGYYSRCRNLIASARFIENELNGVFPSTYNEIIRLKGVGPYTAAAISSFAFNLPNVVVDGNVYRVLARLFGINDSSDTAAGKLRFNELANSLLDKKQPALFNQAIMDFGATICKPVAPLCATCIFKNNCIAFLNNLISELPLKKQKVTIRRRWFYYAVIGHADKNKSYHFAIQKRTAKDIWRDLFEFPLLETKKEIMDAKLIVKIEKNLGLNKTDYSLAKISPPFTQKLTHQLIHGRFISIHLKNRSGLKGDWLWVAKTGLNSYPFPQYINQYMINHLEGSK